MSNKKGLRKQNQILKNALICSTKAKGYLAQPNLLMRDQRRGVCNNF